MKKDPVILSELLTEDGECGGLWTLPEDAWSTA
jgi:hypothetical protein